MRRNFRRFLSKFFKQPYYAVVVLARRIKAYLYYSVVRGRSSYPEAITLFLTHLCNLSCKMCGQWGESGITKRMPKDKLKDELTFDELKDLVDDVSFFKPNITLFGGEPLLYPECIKLIKYIKRKKMHCLMITNGSLLAKWAHSIVDAGLDELNVSLDGDEKIHDEIRGMPGLFEMITKGIKEINKVKKEKGVNKPLVNLQCTITRYNYRYLDRLIDVAKQIEADSLTYHNLIFVNKELIEKQKRFDSILGCSSKEWEGFIFDPQIEVEELYAKVAAILKEKYPFSVDFYPNLSLEELREYYNNPYYVPRQYPARCLSPWMVAYIFPNGEVKPCLNSSYSYGNIKDDKFTLIWNSKKAAAFRRMLKKIGIFPICVRCTELYRY